MKHVYLTLLIVILLSSEALSSHPAEEYAPAIDPGYMTYAGDSSWNQGELQFAGRDERIPFDDLTDMERYMSAGLVKEDGSVIFAWWLRMAIILEDYHDHFGTLPSVMDEQAIRSIPGRSRTKQQDIEWYRNPITGEWPEVANPDPGPGNIFFMPLSTPQKIYLTQFDPSWKRSWFHDLEYSYELHQQGFSYEECFTKVEPITSEVWYFRMYGEDGILMTGTTYSR